jgi:DNA-binding transcriptional MerR regulator
MSDLDPDGEAGRARARKSPTAFRTISEVADDLQIPQHVLRFWESKFPQLKPLKRGGGRRYYRPEDIGLLKRISDLLYTQGYTIKGVQRLLREGGLDDALFAPELPLDHPEPEEAEAAEPLRAALDALELLSHELRALAARG